MQVTVVGRIISTEPTSLYMRLVLDDGTGQIEVKYFQSDEDDSAVCALDLHCTTPCSGLLNI